MTDIQQTLNERGKTHGDFKENSRISQEIKATIHGARQLSDPQAEALDMIAHKISRILAGNPNEPDHWRDIAGYATLIVNQLQNEQAEGTQMPPLSPSDRWSEVQS